MFDTPAAVHPTTPEAEGDSGPFSPALAHHKDGAPDKAANPLTAAAEQDFGDLVITVYWPGPISSADIRAAIKTHALAEQFCLLTTRPTGKGDAVWVCAFQHAGYAENFDRQAMSLLRRLALVAPWARVERASRHWPAAEREDGRYAWDAMARRVLP
ncbi:MAG: hypothetical protein AAGH45_04760 [Pseudomonadota bacterium]